MNFYPTRSFCDETTIDPLAPFPFSRTSTTTTRSTKVMHIPVLLPFLVATAQPQPTLKMCCWPFAEVELENAPKKEEEQKEYVLVSDQLTLHPGVSQSSFIDSLFSSNPTFHLRSMQ